MPRKTCCGDVASQHIVISNKHPRRKRTGYFDELPEIKDSIATLFKRGKQRGI